MRKFRAQCLRCTFYCLYKENPEQRLCAIVERFNDKEITKRSCKDFKAKETEEDYWKRQPKQIRIEKKRLEEYWEKYRIERHVPNRMPSGIHLGRSGQMVVWSRWKARMIKEWRAYHALKKHIMDRHRTMPNNYEKFKREIKYFHGWHVIRIK